MDNKEELIRLGKHIKSLRKKMDISQEKLAANCGKDQQSLTRLETGGINPSYLYLKEIAEGMGIPVRDLVDF